MLNSSQSTAICDSYADLLKQVNTSPNERSTKSKMNWKKNIQDYVSTKDFKRELAKGFPAFRGSDQHDAHEFCTVLLDIMSKELNRVKDKPKYKELKISPKETIEYQAQKWEEYYKEREDSHITDYFQGQNMTEIKCQMCGTSNYSF